MTQAAAAAFLMLVLLFGGPWVTVQSTGAPEPQPARTAQEQTDAPGADESSVLRVWNGTETVEMTMAAYLPGVVRGEMPATFEEEALKAQAVAERTYIYYHLQRGGKANHPDADVCMDHTCCNASDRRGAGGAEVGRAGGGLRGEDSGGRPRDGRTGHAL